jgi:hypothetical protein
MCRIVCQWYNFVALLPEQTNLNVPVYLPCSVGIQSGGWNALSFSFMGWSGDKYIVHHFEKLNLLFPDKLQSAMLMTLEVRARRLAFACPFVFLTGCASCSM